MLKRHSFGRFGNAPRRVLMIGAMGAACAAIAFAQANAPAQLPNGPAKPGFDVARFSSNGGIFKTFNVNKLNLYRRSWRKGELLETHRF